MTHIDTSSIEILPRFYQDVFFFRNTEHFILNKTDSKKRLICVSSISVYVQRCLPGQKAVNAYLQSTQLLLFWFRTSEMISL